MSKLNQISNYKEENLTLIPPEHTLVQ